MQALQDRSTHGKRRRWWLLAVVLVVVLVAGGAGAYVVTRRGQTATVTCTSGAKSASCSASKTTSKSKTKATAVADHRLVLSQTSPLDGATAILPNATVSLRFSAALERGGVTPTISPAISGSWHLSGHDELVFSPDASWIPFQKYTVTVPGGPNGIRGATGGHLPATKTITFTIARGNTARLQQLLAVLGYLPLTYTEPQVAPQDLAMPQPGTLTWRWPSLPTQLTGQWVLGQTNAITKGAVMMFETENGLSVDGIAGPKVWSTLLADVVADKTNTEPVTYVLVTKVRTEHLTAWVNGQLAFKNILVNTGVPGATTRDGTFQVFEHVTYSDMKGCDVTGTCYTDPHVPWASYFNGGDALHGFVRATYGWPQSNGCVEMQVATAGRLWPNTPIGTLVTVQGPTATPVQSTTNTQPPPTTTTTTTTAPPATTTTAAPTTTTTTTSTTALSSSTTAGPAG